MNVRVDFLVVPAAFWLTCSKDHQGWSPHTSNMPAPRQFCATILFKIYYISRKSLGNYRNKKVSQHKIIILQKKIRIVSPTFKHDPGIHNICYKIFIEFIFSKSFHTFVTSSWSWHRLNKPTLRHFYANSLFMIFFSRIIN